MIDTEKDNRKMVERAILVGIQDASISPREAEEHLDELEDLVGTLGIPVIGREMVMLRNLNPRYLTGSGKAKEINLNAKELEADCLIFDGELTPSQQRNWEKLTKICVIDRQEVILDIFASRASTREAVIQVELARMQYSLPRLARAWTHLSRQRGGAKGTRGEGEQQIEADRRIVQQRISHLRKELKEVRQHRKVERKSRNRNKVPHAAIVGYTNAGKSSLLNALCDSSVLVENKLFATLDPTTRKIVLPNQQELLLTDTVGFIRKLPHTLVEAFKSTLEEAALADFLVLVLDAMSPQVEDHWETTLAVLDGLGAGEKDIIVVFNKMDLHPDPVKVTKLKHIIPDGIFISARSGKGFDKLHVALMKHATSDREIIKLKIPPERHDIASLAYSRGNVLDSDYEDNGVLLLTVNISKALNDKFRKFAI